MFSGYVMIATFAMGEKYSNETKTLICSVAFLYQKEINWNKRNQSPTSHCDMIFLIDFLSSALWVLPHQQSLHIRIYDLIGSKNIVTIRYIMPKGVMIAIKNVIQNHKAKYIFWLMLFWVSIHKWFLFSWPPAVPTSGTVQLKNMNV